MPSLRKTLADLWSALNPAEPSPAYLLKFFLFAVGLFLAAYLIGQMFG